MPKCDFELLLFLDKYCLLIELIGATVAGPGPTVSAEINLGAVLSGTLDADLVWFNPSTCLPIDDRFTVRKSHPPLSYKTADLAVARRDFVG